jgi:hypothetical protein
MRSIWGLLSHYRDYSPKGRELFYSLITQCRIEFKREFRNALEDCHAAGLYASDRFNDADRVFWALQSNVSEADFTQLPKHYITRVLLGACEADYYYQFEKEW